MSETIVIGDPAVRRDRTFAEIAVAIWWGKWWVLGGAVLGLLASVLYLDRQTFLYTASMQVTAAPSSQGGSSSRLGALGGLASLAGVGGVSSGGASPFDIYLETLTSEDTARMLARDPEIMRTVFADDWDEQARRWREPARGIKWSVSRAARQLVGLPVPTWSVPDARQLAGVISSQLSIERDTKTPVVRISLDGSDPAFAKRLLSAVGSETDRLVRRAALTRSRSYADYLERKLPTVTVADQRASLIDALGEQEKSLMMANSTTPFAAIVVSGPTVSALPTKPNGLAILTSGTLVGLIIGGLLALVDLRRVGRIFRRREVAEA
jgi:uncharacterized protein involved in exopolysaccharide biosynthesis